MPAVNRRNEGDKRKEEFSTRFSGRGHVRGQRSHGGRHRLQRRRQRRRNRQRNIRERHCQQRNFHRTVEHVLVRLIGARRHHGHRRVAIQTTPARDVRSVREYRLTGFETELLRGPINFVAIAVGNVAHHVGLQGDLFQPGFIEGGVMIPHCGLAHGLPGFFNASSAARHNRERKDLPLLLRHHGRAFVLDCWRLGRKSQLQRCKPNRYRGRDRHERSRAVSNRDLFLPRTPIPRHPARGGPVLGMPVPVDPVSKDNRPIFRPPLPAPPIFEACKHIGNALKHSSEKILKPWGKLTN